MPISGIRRRKTIVKRSWIQSGKVPIKNLPGFLDLPSPGVLNIHGIVLCRTNHTGQHIYLFRNASGIWITPEGHQRWDQVSAGHGETCSYAMDTTRTRTKRFQDRIDLKVLLNRKKVA